MICRTQFCFFKHHHQQWQRTTQWNVKIASHPPVKSIISKRCQVLLQLGVGLLDFLTKIFQFAVKWVFQAGRVVVHFQSTWRSKTQTLHKTAQLSVLLCRSTKPQLKLFYLCRLMKRENRRGGGGSARFIGRREVTWLGFSTRDSVNAKGRQSKHLWHQNCWQDYWRARYFKIKGNSITWNTVDFIIRN